MNKGKKIGICIFILILVGAVTIGLLTTKNIRVSDNTENGKFRGNSISSNLEDQPSVGVTESTNNDTARTSTVTVYYVDEQGNNLTSEPTIKTGVIGSWYEVERLEIEGYTRSGEEPITRAGYYEEQNKDVTFVYKPAGSEVKIGVSNEGIEGATSTEVNVVFNNTKSMTDYGVKVVVKDGNGNPVNGGRFTFSKGNSSLTTGNVTNGELYFGKIAISSEGNIEYGINQDDVLSGYRKVDGKIGLTLTSQWNSDSNSFNVSNATTDKTGTSVNIDEDKKEIVVEVINEKIADMYEMEFIYRCENEYLNGARLKVTKGNSVVKEGDITNQRFEIKEIAITESGSDVYEFEETKGIEGYESALKDGKKAKVAVVKRLADNSYTITGSSNDTGITVNTTGNKVTVYIDVTKIEDDKYDLSMMKYISEIDGVPTQGREPIVHVNSGENKFSYTKKDDIEKAANEQKVTYRLRMYNESERDGKGKTIIEDIPAGLVFIPENETNKKYNWKGYTRDKDGDLVAVNDIKNATVIVSDYLVDKEIKGYDKEAIERAISRGTNSDVSGYVNYLDVEAVFMVDESKVNQDTRIVENIVTIQKNKNDDNNKNDTATEKLYVKFFDLSVMKFIEEVKVKNEKDDKVITVGEAKKGQKIKVDVAESQVDKTTITVTYGLKVTNVGEIEGYATELIDYIPQDFALVENGVWTKDGEKAVSTSISNTILEPGESTIVDITFEWKLAADKIGSRLNEGEISKYENPYNAIDRTSDNKDSEVLIVGVKTGGVYFIVPAIVIIVVASIGAYVIIVKKRS